MSLEETSFVRPAANFETRNVAVCIGSMSHHLEAFINITLLLG